MIFDKTTLAEPYTKAFNADSTVTYANESRNLSSDESTCKIHNAEGNPMVNMTIPFTTFSICVLGNLFAIVFLWRSNQRSDKKHHIFYTLVMTLACCDFVSVIVTSPVTFVAYMSGTCLLELGGMPLCRYSGFAMTFFGIGSVAIVFAMSLERFIAIRFTLYYQRSMTTHKTRMFLIIILVSLLALSALPLLGFGDVAQQYPGSWCYLDWKSTNVRHQGFNFLVAILGIALMIGTIVCNVFVVVTVSKTRRRMRSKNSSHSLLSKGKRKRISQQETQMIVLLGLMTVVFVVCYLPILVYILCRRSVFSKAFRFLKLVFLCRFKKDEFQELCLNSRDFRRRKSTRRQQMSYTFTSINGQSSISDGVRVASRSPLNDLHTIKESKESTTADELSSGVSDELSTYEVNGNHISIKEKFHLEQAEGEVLLNSSQIVEDASK